MPSYNTLAKSLAKFDDSRERTEIAAIEAEQQRDRDAVSRAETVLAEARAALIDLRSGTENIDQLVDDLRSGNMAVPPTESESELERKIEVHLAGKQKLLDDIMHREMLINSVKSRLGTRLTKLSGEVSDSLVAEVTAKLKELSALYADVTALAGCTPNESIHNLRGKLSPSLVEIAKHWQEFWGAEVAVDQELIAALEQGKRSFVLTGRTIPETVKLPHL